MKWTNHHHHHCLNHHNQPTVLHLLPPTNSRRNVKVVSKMPITKKAFNIRPAMNHSNEGREEKLEKILLTNSCFFLPNTFFRVKHGWWFDNLDNCCQRVKASVFNIKMDRNLCLGMIFSNFACRKWSFRKCSYTPAKVSKPKMKIQVMKQIFKGLS